MGVTWAWHGRGLGGRDLCGMRKEDRVGESGLVGDWRSVVQDVVSGTF